MRKFTLTLSDDAASRIEQLNSDGTGSVPGWTAKLATDFSRLNFGTQKAIRAQIADLIKQLEEEANHDGPRTPFAPTEPQAEAKKPHAQVSQQHPQAHTPRSRPGKRASKVGELTAVI